MLTQPSGQRCWHQYWFLIVLFPQPWTNRGRRAREESRVSLWRHIQVGQPTQTVNWWQVWEQQEGPVLFTWINKQCKSSSQVQHLFLWALRYSVVASFLFYTRIFAASFAFPVGPRLSARYFFFKKINTWCASMLSLCHLIGFELFRMINGINNSKAEAKKTNKLGTEKNRKCI